MKHYLARKKEEGFTLIETLIAVAVLTLSIIGPFQIVQGVLAVQYNSRDQLIAAGLAQEGVEYVRQVRDSNYLYKANSSVATPSFNGLNGTNGPDCFTNACVIDPFYYPTGSVPFNDSGQQSVTSCVGTNCSSRPLYLNASYRYTQVATGNTVTKFTRSIRLTTVSANETLVTVTVTWQNHGTRTLILTEYLQDWL